MTDPARKLLTTLRNAQAFGPGSAVCQRVLAGRTGIPVRRLQEDMVLELLAEGYPVATTCREPYGLFLARTAAELEPYCTQLESRCQGLYKRRRLVRTVQRCLQAAEAGTRKPPPTKPASSCLRISTCSWSPCRERVDAPIRASVPMVPTKH